MAIESNNLIAADYFLEPGHILLAATPTIISTVLGSCVSICIYDKKQKVGGINHFQYPYTRKKKESTAKYGNVAAITLIRMMVNNGSKIKNLEAQLFGGALNREISSTSIGLENIIIARKILAKERIRIVSEDVGGEKGRKIVFNTGTNEIAVMKVEKLRARDWYPYKNDR